MFLQWLAEIVFPPIYIVHVWKQKQGEGSTTTTTTNNNNNSNSNNNNNNSDDAQYSSKSNLEQTQLIKHNDGPKPTVQNTKTKSYHYKIRQTKTTTIISYDHVLHEMFINFPLSTDQNSKQRQRQRGTNPTNGRLDEKQRGSPGVAQGFRQHGVEQLRLDGEGGFKMGETTETSTDVCRGRVHGSQHGGIFGVEKFGFGFGFLIVVLFGW